MADARWLFAGILAAPLALAAVGWAGNYSAIGTILGYAAGRAVDPVIVGVGVLSGFFHSDLRFWFAAIVVGALVVTAVFGNPEYFSYPLFFAFSAWAAATWAAFVGLILRYFTP